MRRGIFVFDGYFVAHKNTALRFDRAFNFDRLDGTAKIKFTRFGVRHTQITYFDDFTITKGTNVIVIRWVTGNLQCHRDTLRNANNWHTAIVPYSGSTLEYANCGTSDFVDDLAIEIANPFTIGSHEQLTPFLTGFDFFGAT